MVDVAAFGAAVTDLLTKVTISASNYNASKEVLEKFEHSCESTPKKRYTPSDRPSIDVHL
jgi:hypothetical protein